MQDLVLRVPKRVKPDELRGELERKIKLYHGNPIDIRKYRPSRELEEHLERITWAHGRVGNMIVNPVYPTNTKFYPLYYAVARTSFYYLPLPQPGLIITMTNDLNCFREPHYSNFYYYSARIIFDGFDEYSTIFHSFKRELLSMDKIY